MQTSMMQETSAMDGLFQSDVSDYRGILEQHQLNFKRAGYYLQVGDIKEVQGWIIHISVVPQQLAGLLNVLIPFFTRANISFKVVTNSSVASQIQSGELGLLLVGKTIKIYLTRDHPLSILVPELISLSKSFSGPAVPTDIHLGGNVCARYGGFSPVRILNQDGETENYIYDTKGQLVKDEYFIPCQVPPGITWPFSFLAVNLNPLRYKILKNKYRIVSVLKSDIKGNVFETVYFKGLLPKWCIIKQGNKFTCADPYRRYIHDRLAHQNEMHNKLNGKAPVPVIIDFFIEGGDTYLVMELIKGPLLENKTASIFDGLTWAQLPVNKRLQLLDYVLQIIDIVQSFHENGIVHRDITPANFIVDGKNRLSVIDLELSYLVNVNKPVPPYSLGTIGFMSPEQEAGKIPTFQEDIYGLGALMITMFTSIPPGKFEQQQKNILEEQLNFFTQDQKLVTLILSCLSSDPGDRPALVFIRKTIEAVREQYKIIFFLFSGPRSSDHPAAGLKGIIQKGVKVLGGPVISRQGQIWSSCTAQSPPYIANYQYGQTIYMGLQNGIAGVLYAVARTGSNTSDCREMYLANLQYLQDRFLVRLPNLPGGLSGGSAGAALSLCEGIKNGFIEANERNREAIRECLNISPGDLSLSTGAAGIGLAALCCVSILEPSEVKAVAEKHLQKILCESGNYNSPNWTHEAHGILIFLTCYFDRYRNNDAEHIAKNGLRWIAKNASGNNKMISPWLSNGTAAIGLCFLKAFEVFKDEEYATFAKRLLFRSPKYLSTHLFTHGRGLAGLGEVYLEAYKILSDPEWLDRAGWIARVLTNTCKHDGKGGVYWATHPGNMITADFGEGCAGIIHFLNRYSQPGEFSFPFLPSINPCQ